MVQAVARQQADAGAELQPLGVACAPGASCRHLYIEVHVAADSNAAICILG